MDGLDSHASFFSVPLLEAGAFPGQLLVVAISCIHIEENFWTLNTLRMVVQTLEIALPEAKPS